MVTPQPERRTIYVTCWPEDRPRKVAIEAECESGLAVHRMVMAGDKPTGNLWVITHIGTGLTIGMAYGRRKKALKYLRIIQPLAPWERFKSSKSRLFSKQVRARVSKALGVLG